MKPVTVAKRIKKMVAVKNKIVAIERSLSYQKGELQQNGSTIFPKLLIPMNQLQKKSGRTMGLVTTYPKKKYHLTVYCKEDEK